MRNHGKKWRKKGNFSSCLIIQQIQKIVLLIQNFDECALDLKLKPHVLIESIILHSNGEMLFKLPVNIRLLLF